MFNRILVATDFAFEAVERHALELSTQFRSNVIILHTVETIEADQDDGLEEFYEALKHSSERRMKDAAARFRAAGLEVRTLVTLGKRWSEILSVAEAEQVDLIVLGSRQPILSPPGPVGTTSHKVFLTSHIPLLVVRDPSAHEVRAE